MLEIARRRLNLVLVLSGFGLVSLASALAYFGSPESVQNLFGYPGSALIFTACIRYLIERSESGEGLGAPKPFHVAVFMLFFAFFVASVSATGTLLQELGEYEVIVLAAIPVYWVGFGLRRIVRTVRHIPAERFTGPFYQLHGWIPALSILLLFPMLLVSLFLFPETGPSYSLARIVISFAPSAIVYQVLSRMIAKKLEADPETRKKFIAEMNRKPISRRKALVIAMISIVILLGFFGFVIYESSVHPYWAFNGATAEYYGKATLADGTYAYKVNMTVLVGAQGPLNATSAKVVLWTTLIGPARSYSNTTTILVRLSTKQTNPFTIGTPVRSYLTSIQIEGRTLQATASEFTDKEYVPAGYGLLRNLTIFENQCDVSLPVILSFTTASGGDIVVYLVKTNISGLLPSFPQALGGYGVSSYCPTR